MEYKNMLIKCKIEFKMMEMMKVLDVTQKKVYFNPTWVHRWRRDWWMNQLSIVVAHYVVRFVWKPET